MAVRRPPVRPGVAVAVAWIAGAVAGAALDPPLDVWAGFDPLGFAPAGAVRAACGAALGVAAFLAALVAARRVPLRAATAAFGVALLLGHADASARERRAFDLPLAGGARDVEFAGALLRPPAREADGSTVLLLRGRVRGDRTHPGDPPGKLRTLRCRVRPGPAAADPRRFARGDRLRLWVRLAAPPGSPRTRHGPDAYGTVKSPRLVVRERRAPGAPARAVDVLRRRAAAHLERAYGAAPATHGLLAALLLGERGALPREEEERLRDAGLIHLVAVSGLHVGLVWGLAWVALRVGLGLALVLAPARVSGVARVRRAGAAIGAALVLPAYAVWVGARPSVVRALLFAAVAAAGALLGRRVAALHLLAAAAGLAVAARPSLPFDPAYQLSVAATAGLVLLAGPLARRIPGPRTLAVPAAAATVAALAAGPAGLAWFGRAALAGPVANLAALPLASALLVGGALELPLAALVGSGTRLPGLATCAEALLAWARLVAEHGPAPLRPPPPGPLPLALAAAFGAALAALRLDPAARIRAAVRFGAPLALALALGPPPKPAERPAERVALLDVGQGQALLLRAGHRAALVDAGGRAWGTFDPGERQVVPGLLRRGVRRLDVLALSHADADHAEGAFAVLRALDVGALWLGPELHRAERLRDLAALAVRRGVAVRTVGAPRAGRRDVARLGGLALRVHPVPDAGRCPRRNDRSLVLDARTGPWRVRAPGDLGACGLRAALERLWPRTGPRAGGILVVAHHGSRSGTTAAWLDRFDPEQAWVSCGRGNRFGHPHPEVRRLLRRRGIPLRRTDLEGDLAPRSADERQRQEREHEQRDEHERDGHARGSQRPVLALEARMARAHPDEDREPGQVGRDRAVEPLQRHHRRQRDDRAPAQGPVQSRRHRVGGVAAVELADRKQVQRGHEHPDPGGTEPGVRQQGFRRARDPADRGEERRLGQQEVAAVPGRRGRGLGGRDPPPGDRERDEEPRDRPGGGDVEQRAPVGDAPADPDHRAERPDEGQARDEEGERGRDAVDPAGEVVAHLVRAEDREHEQAVGPAGREHLDVEREAAERGEGGGQIGEPAVSAPAAAREGGGDQGGDQELRVPPDAGRLGRAGRRHGGDHSTGTRRLPRTAAVRRKGHPERRAKGKRGGGGSPRAV